MSCPFCCGHGVTNSPPTIDDPSKCPTCWSSTCTARAADNNNMTFVEVINSTSTGDLTAACTTDHLYGNPSVGRYDHLSDDFPFAAPYDPTTPAEYRRRHEKRLRTREHRRRTKKIAKASKKRNRC